MLCLQPRCSTKFRLQQELGVVLSGIVENCHENNQEANHLNTVYVDSDFGALESLPKFSYLQGICCYFHQMFYIRLFNKEFLRTYSIQRAVLSGARKPAHSG